MMSPRQQLMQCFVSPDTPLNRWMLLNFMTVSLLMNLSAMKHWVSVHLVRPVDCLFVSLLVCVHSIIICIQ